MQKLGQPVEFLPWATPWKKEAIHYYRVEGKRYRIRAEYGIQQVYDQEPHFFMIGSVNWKGRGYTRHRMAIGDHIEAYFPELSRFVKWHLSSAEGPPWYPANGVYWWKIILGLEPRPERSGDPWDNFRQAIVFGALDDDEMPPPDASPEDVEEWLLARLPALRDAFRQAMVEAYELEVEAPR